MLTKNKHTKVNYISRLLVLPLAAIVFIGISCKVKTDTENQKPIDNVEANVPVVSGLNLLTDSMPTMYNDNKKIVGLDVITPRDNPPLAKVTYEDGSKETFTFEEAEAKGIVIPPPPPPPAQIYNGKVIKYITANTTENNVNLTYTDGSKEEITLKEAENANLKFAHLTPPKVVKDTIVRYAPPKVIKNKEVQYTPPLFVKAGLAGFEGGRISLQKIEAAKKLEPSSDVYTVESFTVYFSGAGFPEVKSFSQNGGQFSSEIQKEWENIKPGTAVSFDKVMVNYKDQLVKVNRPPAYIVY